jgi:aminoglycoside phosphotransferase (APT) family kinase protein
VSALLLVQLAVGTHSFASIFSEVRAMQAIHKQGVPVPEILGYCEDAEMIGTPFYVR